ncbi:MAG: hypothetical protein ACYS99_19085 [Planctomycetota bacterium]|jgi:hypothetical protein
MKHKRTLSPVAALLLAAVLATVGGSSTGLAEVPTGSVTIEIELMPSPLQNGYQTNVYGTFTATGAIAAEGTAFGTMGWGWSIRLLTDDGSIDLTIGDTWQVTRGEGAFAGLTGSGDASGVYGTTTDPYFGYPTWKIDWTLTGSVGPCGLPTPTLVSATPGNGQVTLSWSDESADPKVEGYRVYRDLSGSPMLLADVGLATSYTDTYLTNGATYCYKVTAYGESCESGFSNMLCATPEGPPLAGASSLLTGRWGKSGKGKHATTTFELTSSFARGDKIVIRAWVADRETGLPLSGAVVDLLVSGPETRSLTSEPSDSEGYAEATWKTAAPGKGKKGGGGTATGSYSAWVTGVTAAGHEWDGVGTWVLFTVD